MLDQWFQNYSFPRNQGLECHQISDLSSLLQFQENIVPNMRSESNMMNPSGNTSSSLQANVDVNDTRQENSEPEEALEIGIRQVMDHDLLDIVKLFQAFDNDKYKHLQIPELKNGNRKLIDWESRLPRLRIDKKGGIHLQPLLDSNNAYFKCYVAQDTNSQQLIGYILFFHTPSDSPGHLAGQTDDPVAVIEDLFIKPCYRGKGIATQLVRRVFKSSLDRGCSACECILIPDSKVGLQFWKKKIGEKRIADALDQYNQQKQVGGAVLKEQNEQQELSKPITHELAVVLNRNEMVNYYLKMAQ